MVACLVACCASSPSAAGEARAAARARWQAGGATLSATHSCHGRPQNPSTMDGSRGALWPLAARFRLRSTPASWGCWRMS
jgi:hypothetical protein